MRNLFSYDNKVMQILMTLGDLVIVNLLFLLCSLPVVTMGAAQAGLFTAARVITDKDDDSSPAAAFFRGFKNGFGKITAMWIPFLVVIGLSVLTFISTKGGMQVFAFIALFIVALMETLVVLFHSRFDCTPMQLLRNAVLMLIAHPLRSIASTFLSWLTVFVFLYDAIIFLAMVPVLLTLFISVTFLLGYAVVHKTFQELVQIMEDRQAAQLPSADEPEEQTEDSENPEEQTEDSENPEE